ncbi:MULTISPECIES: Abi family protein [Serratia]|uniref:Abi family protein n=1 Tax=Serratia TaxID=613 RepID=UPI0014954F9C|nr:Abi family protein [Serratia marcescens]
MPNSYDYTEPARLLSTARLSSYKVSLATQSDAQLFGAYCWNLAIVGAFYPLIQIIEVSLRNAINHVVCTKYQQEGKYWFELIPVTQDTNLQGDLVNADQVKKFKDNNKKAKKSAKKALEEKGIAQPIPTIDQIISQTEFSTWEYIFDKHFYNGAEKNFLWPHELTKVFKKLPRVTDKNPSFHQRDAIRRRIEEIRAFRNRISHNEPAWHVGSAKTKQEVISSLMEKLNNMMELLYWISPKFAKYVRDVGIETRIKQVLHINEINRYMHTFEQYDVVDLEQLIAVTQRANTENHRCYFSVNGEMGILLPRNTLLLQ